MRYRRVRYSFRASFVLPAAPMSRIDGTPARVAAVTDDA